VVIWVLTTSALWQESNALSNDVIHPNNIDTEHHGNNKQQCGCHVISGPAGSPGVPGVPGLHGSRGQDGQKGDKGELSVKGDTGQQGMLERSKNLPW
jgi:hypothetical protein